jgi:hypothetical protein
VSEAPRQEAPPADDSPHTALPSGDRHNNKLLFNSCSRCSLLKYLSLTASSAERKQSLNELTGSGRGYAKFKINNEMD